MTYELWQQLMGITFYSIGFMDSTEKGLEAIANEEYELIKPTYVECSRCKHHYESIYSDANQGVDCASSIINDPKHGWTLWCGYGSKFDTHVYKSKKNKWKSKVDPICDECIQKMLDNDELVLYIDDYLALELA